ncbi:MAG TPA: VTT domain-containing protein [Solirubrobacterales bacterium]|nr:VTT domain-containing protein [Solirubrobacterales bacterium]
MRLSRPRLEGEARDRARLAALVIVLVIGVLIFFRVAESLDVEGWLESIAGRLGDWIYPLVGAMALLETGAFVGLVAPGETTVILGGALTAKGDQSLAIMLAVVWGCAWAGDGISFLIGQRLGRGFVLRHGPKLRITRERFAQVEAYFERHGGKTILIGRFIGVVRALAPFVAGSSGLPYRAFLPYSILGTGLWTATFVLLGYFGADALNQAIDLAAQGTFYFGAVVATVVALIVAIRFLRKRENRERVVARIEAVPVIRRALPQARFVWHRLTPGGLGLEFTSLVAALSVALFVLIAYATIVSADPGPTPGDEQALELADRLQAGWLTDVADLLAALGSVPATLAVALASAAVLVAWRRWSELTVLAAAVAIIHVTLAVLGGAIERAGPGGSLVGDPGTEFPSSEAALATVYPWLALTLTIRLRPRMTHASALIAAGIVVAAAIGASRVYLRADYISDVNAGWGLGVSAFAACAALAMVTAHVNGIRQN